MKATFISAFAAVFAAAAIAAADVPAPASGQQEFTPPAGKGRLVVLLSGKPGIPHDRKFAADIAKLGYDVVLIDSNTLATSSQQTIHDDIVKAQAGPNALAGKVGLVGFSAGGGYALYFGSKMNDLAAVDICWSPATFKIPDISAMVKAMTVPVLMFSGEKDTYENCCLTSTARQISDIAKDQKIDLTLVTYPDTQHDFINGGYHYNAKSYHDALQKTSDDLAKYLK